MKQTLPRYRYLLIIGLGLLLVASAQVIDKSYIKETEYPRVSGAYRALSSWGNSRAYPGVDIPPGAFMRGYEYSKTSLQPILNTALGLSGGVNSSVGRKELSATARQRFDTRWRPIGPTNGGGRTLAVVFDPLNPDTVYAGAASGGLWRSKTGGVGPTAWERIDTGLPVLGVSTIAFEPNNSEVIYIGTGEVYSHQTAGDLEANRSTRGSYGIGILKSIDGGTNWSKSLDWSYNQRHGVWAVRVDPQDTSVVWAATTDGVYKSVDGGLKWHQKLNVTMVMDLVVNSLDTDIVLVGVGNLLSPGRGIYRTRDGGSSWSQITGGGIPKDFGGKINFGITSANPNVVYASIGNGFEVHGSDNSTWLLRSTNFGTTFTLQSTTDYSRWQGWYSHDVAVHPLDADTVICVGIDVWKSSNAGNTLTYKSNSKNYFVGELPPGGSEGTTDYSHADHHDVIYHPIDPNIIYFANDGGVFRSLNGGETFEGVNGGYQSQQFYNGSMSHPTSHNLAIGGLQDSGSAMYLGSGRWKRWLYGGDGGWSAIHPTNQEIIYATSQWLSVGRSTDGGETFTDISPPNSGGPVAFIAPILISPTNPDTLYAGSNLLFKTFNGGTDWFSSQWGVGIDGNPILLLAIAQQNDDVLYLATAPLAGRGRVHRTLDGGSTFTEITDSLPDRYPGDMTVDPTNQATVYITMSGFGTSHVFKSTDYGSTWIDIDRGILPDVPTTAVVVDPLFPNHVYVGNDISAYVTKDEGASWAELDEGFSEAVLVNDLSISPGNRKLRAFTHGQGVYERNLLTRKN